MTQDELLALIEQAATEGWRELDLSGQDLVELPGEIDKLKQLESLILGKKVEGYEFVGNRYLEKVSGNNLKTLPHELLGLPNLRKLDISGNPLESIPDVVTQILHLEELILIRVELTEISDAIAKLTNLRQLDLSSNKITEIPDAIAQLTNLRQLDLSHNKITEIPDAIAQLTNLRQLDLSHNKITEIPDAITQLTNLRQLDLSHNKITEIPDAITQLTNLTQLYLSFNKITGIPEALAQLINLRVVDLNSNQITEILEALAQLTNLRVVDLGSNKITEIPEALAQLTNLTELHLYDNAITEIPEALAKLTNLTQLILFFNQITEIPEALAQLTNLTELHLSSNQITEIPEALTKLTNLTQLDLGSNKITEIPEAIANLTNLTHLDLSNNQITEIPEVIANLTNLTHLDLSNNQITTIPETLDKLTNLTQLYLSGNQITEIPEAIANLTNLTQFYLSGNQITEIPIEILHSHDAQNIFNYLRQIRTSKTRPLHEAKILLVGQGSVGKTSLIERLIRNKYDKNQPQTDGLNVQTWNVSVNSKDIRLNVWDFGGQEIYHATHQFFLTKRSLYLLVCNCRTSEEENRIEYWLKLIESFGGQSPVIIVGNKRDEQPLDINRKALREKYPNIQAIIETSCQDNIGIDELRTAIFQEIANLKEVYDLLPLSWFEVKQQLESMPQDFISYSNYIGICYENKIPEEQNQEQLIDLLHRLGLVLNFRDHPILKDTNVLKPNWVTEGIYALLSDEILKTQTKGIFTPADLSRILNPERYPIQRHNYLIGLMKEFELCFALECHPPQFLIAGLLPKDQPEETELEGETLEFQYHYKVLPESIISRFIVNTHEKIYNQVYWRSGVMLQYQENNEIYNIARIKADPEDKKIFIAISGRKETRRLFLGILRHDFQKIHKSLPNLEITEWVPVPGYPNHPPLDYQELLGLEAMGESTVTIGKLKLKLNLRQLLDGYESLESRQKLQRVGLESDRLTIVNKIYNSNQAEYKPMTQNTNNFHNSNIANFANQVQDNASQQASDFTQTSGANITEILQLIGNLRQTAAQFPPDIRDDITIDIDDVEAEIHKPEPERNKPKLKKRLIALLTAAGLIAGHIAGITDFTNNVMEIGDKLGIELQLPAGK
ncbi:leucine-rich repeat domain-containing protein [Aulosira sp. FACHB-615]|uniref:leucine-rich repeat domain-containing protein n=1 Tax=Aulosira sp. FACHB-615 TaxID=2692777 RepID=UPI001686A301|nr:leucine-rich repeat domain-containing protein [Aulosira sp. FACHB-615]MBD2490991.1 leucine-rich repeat domain-containing protein [Aulosira sp. FACHB-615]